MPYAVKIMRKIDLGSITNKVAKMELTEKEKEQEWLMSILEHSDKIDKEVFEIIAIVEDRPAKEVAEGSPFKTFASLKSVLENDGMMDFFKQAMQ